MASTTLAYRDDLEGACLRYAGLLDRSRADTGLAGIASVFAARTGRIYAGIAGLGGAALLAGATAARALSPMLPHASGQLTGILLASWPAMVAAYALGRVVGARRVRDVTSPPRTGDVHADLARLERSDPIALARERATRLERASTGLPMMAVALLAPLTVHWVASLAMTAYGDFDAWIAMSLLIVGHAHLALAALYWRFAHRASRRSTSELVAERGYKGWGVLGVTVGVAALPGAAFLLIPPALTAVTGLVFNPVLFWFMGCTLVAERERLA